VRIDLKNKNNISEKWFLLDLSPFACWTTVTEDPARRISVRSFVDPALAASLSNSQGANCWAVSYWSVKEAIQLEPLLLLRGSLKTGFPPVVESLRQPKNLQTLKSPWNDFQSSIPFKKKQSLVQLRTKSAFLYLTGLLLHLLRRVGTGCLTKSAPTGGCGPKSLPPFGSGTAEILRPSLLIDLY
jgi:hypothetical protein